MTSTQETMTLCSNLQNWFVKMRQKKRTETRENEE